MSTFLKRAITGAIFVAVMLGMILLGKFTFLILFAALTVAGVHEYLKLISANNTAPQKIYAMLVAAVFFASNWLYASGEIGAKWFWIFLPICFICFISELFRKTEKPFDGLAHTILSLIYVAVPFSLTNYLVFTSESEFTAWILIGFFFLVWTNDTGAYLVGSAIGKHKLFERISPKKTWEGSIGGALLAMGVGCVLSFFVKEISLLSWMALALIVAVIGTYGDLAESMMKRSLGIKDSGSLLPGHGGILDRFDALILAVPFAVCYLKLFA